MALAQPGDPYIDNKGNVVQPRTTKTDVRPMRLATNTSVPIASAYQAHTRRSIKELFAEPQTQSVINAVLMYTLLGMTPNEISHLLDTSVVDVQHIIALPAYQETFEALFREMISANSNSLQARISAYAANAVENVMDLASVENDDEHVPAIVKLKANQDILDRSGLSTDALFGKGSQDDANNTLQIQIVEAADSHTNIVINTGKKR